MNENEFLQVIYSAISPGDQIQKPRSICTLLEIKPNRDIVYSVGKVGNKKSVTESELKLVFEILQKHEITIANIRKIIPPSKNCNSGAIQWLLTKSGVVAKQPDGGFKKSW